MKRHPLVITLLFLPILMISGCQLRGEIDPEASLRHFTVLMPSPDCEPPCWRGLQPGKTTASEAINLLKSIEEIDPDSIEEEYLDDEVLPTEIHRFGWAFPTPALERRGRADFVEGRLAWLWFTAHEPSLSLGRALNDLYGEPDSVLVTTISHDSKWTQIILLYLEKGIALTLVIKDYPGETVKIDPEMPVSETTYYDTGLYDLVAELSVPALAVEKGLWLKRLQDWKGFDHAYQVVE